MFQALLTAAKVVAPVILTLMCGRLFALLRGFTREQAHGLGIAAFWVFLPILIFKDVAKSDPVDIFNLRLSAGIAFAMTATGIIGYRYARLVRVHVKQVGVIAQAAFRSNMMYVGLPVLLYHAREAALIDGRPPEEYAQAATMFAAATIPVAVPLMNICSILFFILPERHTNEEPMGVWQVLWMGVSNPLVVATLLGLLVALSGKAGLDLRPWLKPEALLGRTVEMISNSALPVALFAVGAMLDTRRALRDWRKSLPVVLMKLVLSPMLGLAVLLALGSRGLELTAGVILLACPSAAASHAMALEMGADADFAGDLVAATTMMCPVTLVVWLAVLSVFGA